MLCLGVGERAEGTDWQSAGTAGRDVTEFPAFLALGVLRGGEHLLHSPVSGEKVDGGEDGESVGRGHSDNPGGCGPLVVGFWVGVNGTR